jgi:metallo-beta-lactamase class B
MSLHRAAIAIASILLTLGSFLGVSQMSTLLPAYAGNALRPSLTPSPVPEHFPIAEDLYGRQIREDVFIFTHEFPWPANSMLVVMGDGTLVLVDTPYTPQATEALVGWMRQEFGERDLIAINTGYHVDNLGGNSYLVAQDIPVYGSDMTAQLLAERGESTRAYLLEWLRGVPNQRFREAHAAIPYTPPNHLFPLEEGIEFEFGSEVVQVYYPGPSHTLDNVVVYFPTQRILFGGCMILAGEQLGNTEDANLDAWPQSVRALTQFEFDILVPGHGDRFDTELIQHTLELLGPRP